MTKKLALVALTPALLWMLGCPLQTATEAPVEAKEAAKQDTALTAQAPAKPDCKGHKPGDGKPCDCKDHDGKPCDCKGHKDGTPCDCKGHDSKPCDCAAKKVAVQDPGPAGAVEHDCDKHDTKLIDDTVTKRVGEDGKEIAHVGATFTESVEVSVADLLAKTGEFTGKTVRVKGDINAMCNHKRGWFSITAGDQSGRYVRVITAPNFLVPAGSIGKTGVAEGEVGVVEMAAGFAKHIAKEHKLGDSEKIEGNVKVVVIRATGADFI